jgi:hypothetical protein
MPGLNWVKMQVQFQAQGSLIGCINMVAVLSPVDIQKCYNIKMHEALSIHKWFR